MASNGNSDKETSTEESFTDSLDSSPGEARALSPALISSPDSVDSVLQPTSSATHQDLLSETDIDELDRIGSPTALDATFVKQSADDEINETIVYDIYNINESQTAQEMAKEIVDDIIHSVEEIHFVPEPLNNTSNSNIFNQTVTVDTSVDAHPLNQILSTVNNLISTEPQILPDETFCDSIKKEIIITDTSENITEKLLHSDESVGTFNQQTLDNQFFVISNTPACNNETLPTETTNNHQITTICTKPSHDELNITNKQSIIMNDPTSLQILHEQKEASALLILSKQVESTNSCVEQVTTCDIKEETVDDQLLTIANREGISTVTMANTPMDSTISTDHDGSSTMFNMQEETTNNLSFTIPNKEEASVTLFQQPISEEEALQKETNKLEEIVDTQCIATSSKPDTKSLSQIQTPENELLTVSSDGISTLNKTPRTSDNYVLSDTLTNQQSIARNQLLVNSNKQQTNVAVVDITLNDIRDTICDSVKTTQSHSQTSAILSKHENTALTNQSLNSQSHQIPHDSCNFDLVESGTNCVAKSCSAISPKEEILRFNSSMENINLEKQSPSSKSVFQNPISESSHITSKDLQKSVNTVSVSNILLSYNVLDPVKNQNNSANNSLELDEVMAFTKTGIERSHGHGSAEAAEVANIASPNLEERLSSVNGASCVTPLKKVALNVLMKHSPQFDSSNVGKFSSALSEHRGPLKKLDNNTQEPKAKKQQDTMVMPDVIDIEEVNDAKLCYENKENVNRPREFLQQQYDLSVFSDTPPKPKGANRRDTIFRLFDPLYESEKSTSNNVSPALKPHAQQISCITEEHVTAESAAPVSCKQINNDLANTRELATVQLYKSKMDDAIEEKMVMEQEMNRLKLELNQLQQERAALELELHQKDEVILKAQAEAHKNTNQYKQEIKQLQDKLNTINEHNNGEEVKLLREEISMLKEREALFHEKLNKYAEKISSYKQILDGYEDTLSTVTPESKKLKDDHDTVKKHLASIEISFNDLHTKYERSKNIIVGYKNNEEALMERLKISNQIAKKYEDRYETLKAHAKSQLEKANRDLAAVKEKQHTDMSKMNAIIKRLEIKNASIQQALEQKTKECAAVASLCDELAGSAPQ